jgi:signal transduction histidine kinase
LPIALEELDHLRKLTSDLLPHAKLEPLHTARLDELIADAVQRISREAQLKTISIQIEIGDTVEILGIEERLQSVLLNVIENAIKYTLPGGVINISLTRREQDAQIIV